jgi:hypothetical protein
MVTIGTQLEFVDFLDGMPKKEMSKLIERRHALLTQR